MTTFRRLQPDEELRQIVLAQQGDAGAVDRIVKSQWRWAWKCAGVLSNRHSLDFDECLSIAMESILHCIRLFNPDRGSGLSHYLHRTIRSRVFSRLDYHNRQMRRGTLQLASGHMLTIDSCRTSQPENAALLKERREAVRNSISKLPHRSRDIVLRRMNGETLELIRASWGLSRERIRQIECRAHRALRGMLRHIA